MFRVNRVFEGMAFQSPVGGVGGGSSGESLCQVVGNKGELLGTAAAELDESVYYLVFNTVGRSYCVDIRVFLDQVLEIEAGGGGGICW